MNKKIIYIVFVLICGSSPVKAVEFDLTDDVSIELEGKLHYDAAMIDNGRDKKQDSQVRRASLSATAKFGDDVRASIEYDIKGATPTLKDAYIEYKGFDKARLKVGNISHRVGLENSTSSSQIPFMERSAVNNVLPSQGVGMQINTYNKNWTLSASVTGAGAKSFSEFDDKATAKEVVSTRATAVIYEGKNSLVHLGSTLARTNPKGKKVKFSAKSGSKLSDTTISTGKLDTINSYFTEGLEMAWNNGGLLVQGEYIHTQLHDNTAINNNIEGWQLSAAYAVSGAKHKYNKKKGVFSAPTFKKGNANIELGARISEFNLNSKTLTGGITNSKTIGANYYLDDKTRVMLDYDWADVKHDKNSVAHTTKTLQARFQRSFY